MLYDNIPRHLEVVVAWKKMQLSFLSGIQQVCKIEWMRWPTLKTIYFQIVITFCSQFRLDCAIHRILQLMYLLYGILFTNAHGMDFQMKMTQPYTQICSSLPANTDFARGSWTRLRKPWDTVAKCRCTTQPPSVGIGSWGWRMWCLAICSYRTRFACPLVECPLPGKSLQGSRKLSEHNSSHTILSLQHSQILKLFA
jgi:hypothetical protein